MGIHDYRELNRPRWEFSLDETREPFPIATYRVADELYPNVVVMSDGKINFSGTGGTVPAGATVVALTDSSGGTPSNTIADAPAAYAEATMANHLASLAGKINELRTVLVNAGLIA
jgi:hypothetical protein